VQAALGTQLQIATLDGDKEIDVPSGTQPGAELRLRGLGAPALRGGRRGDLMIEVNVDVPTQLTPEEAELLAQFAAMRGEHVSPPSDGLFSRIRSAFKS
jgi:molecular chaperone DnaJ